MPAPEDRLRLAAALRRLATVTVARDLDDGALSRAAEEAERLAASLEAAARPGRAPRVLPDAGGRPQDLFPASPVIGAANPISPPVTVWRETGEDGTPELRGTVRFSAVYEGPPTCVHGGVIAEVFDEILGATLIAAGRPGMTGTLTVRFRRPTPLQVELTLVGRPTTLEGRKIGAWAAMYHEGELTAEADGVFIAVPPSQMLAIVNANAARAGPDVIDPGLRAFIEGGGEVLAAE